MISVGEFYDRPWTETRRRARSPAARRVFRFLFPGLFRLLDREQRATFHLYI